MSPTLRRALLQASQMLAIRTKSEVPSLNTTSKIDIEPYATNLNGVNQPRNMLVRDASWWSLGILAMIILVVRIVERLSKHYRHLNAMSLPATHQKYWAQNNTDWWKLKKQLLYAPLWNKRHNREFKLSEAVNMGTLPSRLHSLLIVGYLISNIAYCAYLDYGTSTRYQLAAELRGRAGILAVVNMLPLVILAGRNNPLIGLLQISFDTYNLVHRWLGRIVVLQALVHTSAYVYVKSATDEGWAGIGRAMVGDPFILWGTVGTVTMIVMLLHSPSPIRHAFYEIFLHCHIVLATLVLWAVWYHIHLAKLNAIANYMLVIMFLWTGDRVFRFGRLVYYNYQDKKYTSATIVAMPAGATKVTVHLPRFAEFKPGSHAYLRFWGINFWESHPFSIAWVEHNYAFFPLKTDDREKGEEPRVDKSKSTTDVSFVIHAQSGMTKKLNQLAEASRGRPTSIKAAFEGPYGGHHSLDSYGHVVLYAGSSGITHQIPYIVRLIDGFNNDTVATRRITLVWIIREASHLEWVRLWMDEILKLPNRRDILRVKLYVTRPDNPKDIHSPSAKVEMFPGRPNHRELMKEELRNQVGTMCVTACGPGALCDEVREVVRDMQEYSNVDFIEESFTW